jgi:hypothetical protein
VFKRDDPEKTRIELNSLTLNVLDLLRMELQGTFTEADMVRYCCDKAIYAQVFDKTGVQIAHSGARSSGFCRGIADVKPSLGAIVCARSSDPAVVR